MRNLALAVCLSAVPLGALSAQAPEDEAHRLDRLRTQALNRDAAAAVARRDDPGASREHDTALRDYADARARYQRRLADWRAQVAACQDGDWSACEPR